MNALHITQAIAMLDAGKPVKLTVVKKNGSLMACENVVSLRYDYYKGTRTVKFLSSGQIRLIHDCMIVRINDSEVFL